MMNALMVTEPFVWYGYKETDSLTNLAKLTRWVYSRKIASKVSSKLKGKRDIKSNANQLRGAGNTMLKQKDGPN